MRKRATHYTDFAHAPDRRTFETAPAARARSATTAKVLGHDTA